MTELPIKTARVFEPLLAPARYKGAYGGRGSGKSHFFAEALIEDSLTEPGLLSVCIREVQKSLIDQFRDLNAAIRWMREPASDIMITPRRKD